jgi:DNA replication and repair protein RecF
MITSLQIEGFRNISHTRLDLDKGISLFNGPNGAGKTNLLEALGLFSLGKSCRGSKDNAMVGFDREMAEITAEITGQKKKPRSLSE